MVGGGGGGATTVKLSVIALAQQTQADSGNQKTLGPIVITLK